MRAADPGDLPPRIEWNGEEGGVPGPNTQGGRRYSAADVGDALPTNTK